MNQDLALRVLGQIMPWSDDRARDEFNWLRLMARLKYDGYNDFKAGVRFIESLTSWLQQFDEDDREDAYRFVRHSLVYVSPSEMEQIVDTFYPRTVRERLHERVSAETGVPRHLVLAPPESQAAIQRLRRETLFMGLSDGARIDTIRHENAGTLSNEQFLQGTQIDTEKWEDLLENLRKDVEDENARFKIVYLVDDFVATGTSFLRFNDETNLWKGKLIKFLDSIQAVNKTTSILDEAWELCIHHHLASFSGSEKLRTSVDAARKTFDCAVWASQVHVSFGAILPELLPIDRRMQTHREFIDLTNKYYDPVLRTRHTDVGGVEHLGLGYGGCALPLVLDHNTPNNSVALLWAETSGSGDPPAHAMRPLFRRRQRHS